MWCPSLLSSTHSLRALEEAGAGEADNGAQEDAGEGDAPGADDGEEHDGDAEEEDNNLQALPGRLPLASATGVFRLKGARHHIVPCPLAPPRLPASTPFPTRRPDET